MKPPLLFVHGAWHGAWCWQPHFVPYFSALGYECHTLDLSGHGDAPPKGRFNAQPLSLYVQDVADKVASLPTPPVLIGHSMGGFIVQHYLTGEKGKGIPAAVLVASIPHDGIWRMALRLGFFFPFRTMRGFIGRNMYIHVNSPEKARWAFYSERLPEAELQEYTRQLGNESFRVFWDTLILDRPKARPLQTPLLVMGAGLDKLFLPKSVEATARAYSVKAESFPTLGHNMMLDVDWELAAKRIAAWLESVTAKPAAM